MRPWIPPQIRTIATASLARIGTRFFVYSSRGTVYVVREARA